MINSITYRCADLTDAPLLARMNQQLIQDAGSRKPMGLTELELQMRDWLIQDWCAILIKVGELVVGYCLYQQRCDEYRAEQPVIHVRQFFVARAWRRQGIGRRAFERIAAVQFPDETILELEVLSTNETGRAFWHSLGFVPHSVTLKRPACLFNEDLYA